MHQGPVADPPAQTRIPSLSEGIPGYARQSKPDARDHHGTAAPATSQAALERLLSSARLKPYIAATGGEVQLAADLYLWATQLAGALHALISFVEIAIRNAIDTELAAWNTVAGGSPEWSRSGATAEPLYSLLRRPLSEARKRADQQASERGPAHHRHGQPATHDDVVAQLMFGSWVRLVRPVSTAESPARQRLLWEAAVHRAFPNAPQDDSSRVAVGDQLEMLRRLRNRIAHHDNLLAVDVRHRLNGMLALLAKIDDRYPALAAARSTLRRLIREDPRRARGDLRR